MTPLTAEYRELLTTEESAATLDRAIRLAVRIASADLGKPEKRWKALQPGPMPAAPKSGKTTNGARYRAVLWALNDLATEVKKSTGLPEDQYSLLSDTLLLIFHQACFALLPELKSERTGLLKAFEWFASTVNQSQDRFQVLGLVALESGRYEVAAQSFRAALASTHSDAHDFITRVQMLWTVLMEHERHTEAFEMLLEVYPRVARNDLEEVASLLRETFHELRRGPTRKVVEGRARKHA